MENIVAADNEIYGESLYSSLNMLQQSFTNHDGYVVCYFFLANGQMVALECGVFMTFNEIKKILFEKAAKMPFFHVLKDQKFYTFTYVNTQGMYKEITQQQEPKRSLSNLRALYKPYFMLNEASGTDVEKYLTSTLQLLAGNLYKMVFENRDDRHIEKFLHNYRNLAYEKVIERETTSWDCRLAFAYPPSIEAHGTVLPDYLRPNLHGKDNTDFTLEYVHDANLRVKILVNCYETPAAIIGKIVQAMKKRNTHIELDEPTYLKVVGENNFFINWYDDYDNNNNNSEKKQMVEYKIIQYKYIRECISTLKNIAVTLLKKSQIKLEFSISYLPELKESLENNKMYENAREIDMFNKNNLVGQYKINPNMRYCICIGDCGPLKSSDRFYCIEVAIFHGNEKIGDTLCTKLVQGPHPHFNEVMEFKDIFVINLPRMARICMCLYSYSKNKRSKNCELVGWLNVPICEYDGIIFSRSTYNKADPIVSKISRHRSTVIKCHFWPFSFNDTVFNSSNADSTTAVSNSNNTANTSTSNHQQMSKSMFEANSGYHHHHHHQSENTTSSMSVSTNFVSNNSLQTYNGFNPLGTVSKYTGDDAVFVNLRLFDPPLHIVCPTQAEYENYLTFMFSDDGPVRTLKNYYKTLFPDIFHDVTLPTADNLESITADTILDETKAELDSILKINPISKLTHKQAKFIWSNWHVSMVHCPEMLPKLISCISWSSKEQVALMMYVLKMWPKLTNHEAALQLLDYCYMDTNVRQYAVDCLSQMCDVKLELYLLQLVQALKFETYYDCPLARYLVTRAFKSRRILHYLFWYLRAELNEITVATRFSLLLDIICRSDIPYCAQLLRQVEFIERLEFFSANLQKVRANLDREVRKSLFKEFVSMPANTDLFQDLINPLDPRISLREMVVEQCDVKESKKKPIVLTFRAADTTSDSYVRLLFKYGDDLRQDILTLQTLVVMNEVWRSSNYDLKIVPYKVMYTGSNSGLIEMVDSSTTLGKIQHLRGFKRTTIYDWLMEQQQVAPSKSFDVKIDHFRTSLTAYSVATLVLGIGDRHNDNVMLRSNGQLFHIDFGHFLGNFKSFLGIRRELVPFIMTKEFVYAATKGSDDVNTVRFREFQKYCEDVYMTLRNRGGNLLVSLFALMVNSNLPELNKPDDLKFLINSLCLQERDDKALQYFRDRFREAYNLRWTTYLNFYAHNKKMGGSGYK